MFRFRLRELLASKERRDGCRIPLREVSEVTGISAQVLSSLTSPDREVVTNTAFVDALCRYFTCTPNELMILVDSPVGNPCHVDELYPNRRR